MLDNLLTNITKSNKLDSVSHDFHERGHMTASHLGHQIICRRAHIADITCFLFKEVYIHSLHLGNRTQTFSVAGLTTKRW